MSVSDTFPISLYPYPRPPRDGSPDGEFAGQGNLAGDASGGINRVTMVLETVQTIARLFLVRYVGVEVTPIGAADKAFTVNTGAEDNVGTNVDFWGGQLVATQKCDGAYFPGPSYMWRPAEDASDGKVLAATVPNENTFTLWLKCRGLYWLRSRLIADRTRLDIRGL